MLFNPLRRVGRQLWRISESYNRRVADYGASAKGVFWKSTAHQLLRFETLCAIFEPEDLEKGGVTINDFGCGYGGLFDYLEDKPVMKAGRYVGTDMSEGMIRLARARVADRRAKFVHQVAVKRTADYTFACGTYNMHLGADDAEWRLYIKESLRQLWGHTKKGLAFNLLRDEEDQDFEGLFYANGPEFLAFCRQELSQDTVMTTDYPLPDYSFFVRRGD